MDFTALIDPIIKAAQRIQHTRGSSSSSNISLDRALGTVASLTLTIGLCRILSAAYKKTIGNNEVGRRHHADSNEYLSANANNDGIAAGGGLGTSSSVYELVKIILRSVLMGDGVKRITNRPSDGKEYIRNKNANRNRVPAEIDHAENDDLQDSDAIISMMGSCHCKAVSFILKAPKNITAQDCHGKIRYPHHITKADNFQLVSGTPYLSVYYVNLSQDEQGHGHNQGHNMIAAHTFCSRCGVHILRAPNSHSDRLEINTNCLDEVRARDGNVHANNSMRKNVNVYAVDDRNGMGLSGGKAAMEFMNKIEYQKQLMERDSEEAESVLELGKIAVMSSEDDSLSLDNSTNWGQSMAERWKRQQQQQQYPTTPLTISSSLPSVLAGDSSVVSESEVDDSHSEGLSYDGSTEGNGHRRSRRRGPPTQPLSTTNGEWLDTSRSSNISLSRGNTTIMNSDSSFSLPKNPFDDSRSVASASTIGNGSITGNGSIVGDGHGRNNNRRKQLLPPSSALNDQLRYYMKKHMSSPTIQEDKKGE